MKNEEQSEREQQEAIEGWKRQQPHPVPYKMTWKPTVAGIANIIIGSWGIIASLLFIILFIAISAYSPSFSMSEELLWFYIVSSSAAGILVILGGIYALNRKKWVWALIGSICTVLIPIITLLIILDAQLIFSLWVQVVFYTLSGALCISVIILTLLSKNEFE